MVKDNYAQKLKPKNYLVSYMEKGVRIKFIVNALRKPDAIFQAELQGADKAKPKTAIILNNWI